MLRRWAVREHFVSGAYPTCPIVFNFTHNSSRGSSCAFWYMNLTHFWFRTMTYLDVLTHTSFPEQISKSTGPITVILNMFSKVPSCAFSSFWTLKLTQHFDLIYDIHKSD